MSRERAAQLVEAGTWLRLSGDVSGARRLFEQALKLDPGNARAQELLEEKEPGPATPAPKPPAADANPFERPQIRRPSTGASPPASSRRRRSLRGCRRGSPPP